MNHNTVLAILVQKGILTIEEAKKIVEHLAYGVQSTYLDDAIIAVAGLLDTATATVEKIDTVVATDAKQLTDKSKKK